MRTENALIIVGRKISVQLKSTRQQPHIVLETAPTRRRFQNQASVSNEPCHQDFLINRFPKNRIGPSNW